MSVKIGSARIDENGKATGGKAGDQTGKEVSVQNWYKQTTVKKRWRVFRCKDDEQANKIAQDMQWACDNKNIGYDQNQRLTLYNEAKKVGFNCAKVATPCETDCSALVRVCCAYAGIDLPNFRTTTEGAVLLASGAFEEMKGSKYSDSSDYLKRGDILVTSSQGHTVIVLNDGKKANDETPTKKIVLVTGNSVYIRTAPNVKTGKVLGIAHKNDILPYGEQDSADGWHLVEYKNQNAWISGKYSIVTDSN